MTTIVWDGATLASDSKASQGNIAMIGDAKKIHVAGEKDYWEVQGVKVLAFALAGDPDMLPWILEELEKGVTHKSDINYHQIDFVAILITEKGECWYWGIDRNSRTQRDVMQFSPVTGPCSAGSGQIVANAVMSIGKSAKDAVKSAIRLDNHSGGAIQTWEFPGTPEVLSVRPVAEAVATEATVTPEPTLAELVRLEVAKAMATHTPAEPETGAGAAKVLDEAANA